MAEADSGAVAPLTRVWLEELSGAAPRIVLADGDDARTIEAAGWLARHTPIRPLLVADPTAVAQAARRAGIEVPGAVEIVAPAELAADPVHAGVLDEAFANRSAGEREAASADPLYLAVAALRAGAADGCVGGSARPTGDVIRAGLRVLGLAPGTETVTSSFLMILPDGRVLGYADCAVIPEPDAGQLAEICVSTSRTFARLTGGEPIVAMLSFSTKGSAAHPAVDRVRRATELAHARDPALIVDGELQFDAALIESIGSRKAPGSPLPGRANVFVFPSLDAGNIAYKITERLAHAVALGPILQGFAGALNDVSRGCSVSDIAIVSLITATQASGPAAPAPGSRKGRPPRTPRPLEV